VRVAPGSTVKSSVSRSEITRTVAGQLGVVSMAALGSRTAAAFDGEVGAAAIADAVGSRIMSDRWAGSLDEPFSPLAFRLSDDRFVVILRGVVDRGTTEWVTSRLCKAIEPPVEVGEVELDPAPVFGVAFGDVRHWASLLDASALALEDARLGGPGTVVTHKVDANLVEMPSKADLIDVESGTAVGMEVTPLPLPSTQQEAALGIDRLEQTARATSVAAGQEMIMSVGAEVLCRRDAGVRLLALAAETRMVSGELVVSVPPRIASPGFGTARRTTDALRREGISVLVDLSSAGPLPQFDSDILFDGVIVDAGAVVRANGPRSKRRNHLLHSLDPRIRVIVRGAGPSHKAFMEPLGIQRSLSSVWAWRSTKSSRGRVTPMFPRSDRTIGVGHPAQLTQVHRPLNR